MVDKVFLIRTGTAPVAIHGNVRLSQTSCLLHPGFSPLLKKISTLSDKHLHEGILPLLKSSFVSKTLFYAEKIQKQGILSYSKIPFSLKS